MPIESRYIRMPSRTILEVVLSIVLEAGKVQAHVT